MKILYLLAMPGAPGFAIMLSGLAVLAYLVVKSIMRYMAKK